MVKSGKLKRLKIISRLLFILYMLVVVYCMFFSETLGRTYISESYRYNLKPMSEIMRFHGMLSGKKWMAALFNLAGNVLCFVPFGIFLPVVFKECRRIHITLLMTFSFSMIIEIIQLVSRVGCFDVDDIIMNTAGGFIGYIIYALSGVIWRSWELHHEK